MNEELGLGKKVVIKRHGITGHIMVINDSLRGGKQFNVEYKSSDGVIHDDWFVAGELEIAAAE